MKLIYTILLFNNGLCQVHVGSLLSETLVYNFQQ